MHNIWPESEKIILIYKQICSQSKIWQNGIFMVLNIDTAKNNLFDFTMLCNVSDKFFELLKQNLAYDIFIVN